MDKILKGAKPSDLPVALPTNYKLRINLKTAKQLGLPIPPAVLLQATRVIKSATVYVPVIQPSRTQLISS